MFARATGAEDQRPMLYLVPDGDESDGSDIEPKAPPNRMILSAGRLAAALKEKAVAILAMALLIAAGLMPQFASHASVAITIDTDVLFGSVNDWIATFLPIFAIGLGIAIALAIIAIVGDSILMGLRRGALRG